MSDENNNDNTNGPSEKKTLSLGKNVGQGTVRQSFSHGRSKAVVVEKRKRPVHQSERRQASSLPCATRTGRWQPGQKHPRVRAVAMLVVSKASKAVATSVRANVRVSAGNGRGGNNQAAASGQRGLTSSENAKRLQALEAAKLRAKEMELKKKEDEARRKEMEAKRKVEEEARRKEEEARAAQAAIEAKKAEEERKVREAADAEKAKQEAAVAKAKQDERPAPRQDRNDRGPRTGDRNDRGGRGDRPGGDRSGRPPRSGDRPGGDRSGRPPRSGDRPGGDRSGRPPRSGDRPG